MKPRQITLLLILILALGIVAYRSFDRQAARPLMQNDRDLISSENEILDAALQGDLEKIKSSFSHEKHLQLRDDQGYTILMLAVDSGKLNCVAFLLSKGAKINDSLTDGTASLHIAVSADYFEIVEFLLKNGADVNARAGTDKATPLMWAAEHDNKAILSLLLAYGARTDAKDAHNNTASRYTSSEDIKALLK